MKNRQNTTTRWRPVKISDWLSVFHQQAGIWLQVLTKQFKSLSLNKARKMDSNNCKLKACCKVSSEIIMSLLLMIPLVKWNLKTASGQLQVKKYPWEAPSKPSIKPTLVSGLIHTAMVFPPNVSHVKINPSLISSNSSMLILTWSFWVKINTLQIREDSFLVSLLTKFQKAKASWTEVFWELKLSLYLQLSYLMTPKNHSSEIHPSELLRQWLLIMWMIEPNREKEMLLLIQPTFWNSDPMEMSCKSSKDLIRLTSCWELLVVVSSSGTSLFTFSPNFIIHTRFGRN